MTTNAQTAYTTTVTLGASLDGYPQPQIDVRFPRGTNYRVVKAAMHRLAAEVELATPPEARWIVQVGDTAGRVYLELARATAEEAERGMAILQQLTK